MARRATSNSLASFLSSQPSSQSSRNDQTPPEDLLRDLIAVLEASKNAASEASHGVKRPHDDDDDGDADEPRAKRDKLVEELDRMFASHPAPSPAAGAPVSLVSSASGTASYSHPPGSAANIDPGGPTAAPGTQRTLPVRTALQPLSRLGSGAETYSHGAPDPPDPGSSSSGSDDTVERPVDDRTTQSGGTS